MGSSQWVQAQGVDDLVVLPPDCSDFPIMSTQIKPMIKTEGVDDLQIEDVTVIENGRPVTVVALEKQRAGVHFTLAINGDRRFVLRDADGISPYDRMRAVLGDWVDARRFASEDSFSLVTQEAALVRNTINRETWIEGLTDYQPNFRGMTPDLASLETALVLSAERVVPFGVDKALLYITPPPAPEEIVPILTLTETARSAGIEVSVWMLGEDYFLANDQGGALIELAAVTGGQFFHYTGTEPLPDPERYLKELGFYYDLGFESTIRQEGTYTIEVIAALPDGEVRGQSAEFYIDVQPPNPILLSPPAGIERTAPVDWEGDFDALTPDQVTIEFILEFQDDYPRDLVRSRLVVDGRVVDENDQAPFETLAWDLTPLVEPGEYTIQVWVEDSLGLTGETIQTPIQVEVLLPEPEPPISSQQIGVIVVGVILGAAVVLLIIWLARHFLQGKFAHHMARRIFDARRKRGVMGADASDQGDVIYATLLPLVDDNPQGEMTAIHITQRQTVFGSDPNRADQALSSEDIAELHARLRVRDGIFWLSDSGSASGTWVNYGLIGRDPVQIQPGDVIHLGSIGFRFTMVDVVPVEKPTVSKYEPLL
jgi:hypothetical protein